MQAAALAVRSQQRGYRNVKANVLDAGVTGLSLGMVNGPMTAAIEAAGWEGGRAAAANLATALVSDGPQIALCVVQQQTSSGC